jgi:hypothetical protein
MESKDIHGELLMDHSYSCILYIERNASNWCVVFSLDTMDHTLCVGIDDILTFTDRLSA